MLHLTKMWPVATGVRFSEKKLNGAGVGSWGRDGPWWESGGLGIRGVVAGGRAYGRRRALSSGSAGECESWKRGSPVHVAKGVLVDDRMQTSVPGVLPQEEMAGLTCILRAPE